MRTSAHKHWLPLIILVVAGCGTTRITDTQRTATEQLLISNSVDQAVSELDFCILADKSVYFDTQYLDGNVDRGYLVSSMRQHLLACGCILQDERAKAAYVVEARAGGIGTDRHALLIGVPQMTIPALLPGQPSQIPEVPFAKKTDQVGVAKLAVFAYNRQTGKPVWQSGVVQAVSTSHDMWVLGAGPFQRGTIRSGTEFAGQPLPAIGGDSEEKTTPGIIVTEAASWPDVTPLEASRRQLTWMLGAGVSSTRLAVACTLLPPRSPEPAAPAASTATAAAERGLLERFLLGPRTPAPPAAATATAAPKPPPPPTPNLGGQAETEPSKMIFSGLGVRPDG